MWRFIVRLLWVGLFVGQTQATAFDAALERDLFQKNDLSKGGETQFSWFGLKVYDIALWWSADNYDNSEKAALTIRYLRDIPADNLIAETRKQWHQQGKVTVAQETAWSQRLKQLWPDVSKGDVLTVYVESGQESLFYANDQPLGSVADSAFGPAFLSIWLSDRAKYPKLREQLLGQQ
ncbi:MAG: chalcone isomerase family protein [Gammaproteobacteria bacterium]|nr:chalcone isomerase family protein [Gammaproteobacteria bacterium]